MKKIAYQFTILTFVLMTVCWGSVAVLGLFGFTLNHNNPWLFILYPVGGLSPTIASYFVLKKNCEITGIRDWLKNIFDVKQSVSSYAIIFILLLCYFLPLCLLSGFTKSAPWYYIILMLPMMLLGGGLEEAGWRYILQPELEQKLPFFFATITLGIIWALWHLPLFYIQGVMQYGTSYLIFFINIMASAFALATIRKITKSIWLCVLFHCFANAIQNVYIIKQNLIGACISTIIVVIISMVLVKAKTKNLTEISAV